MMPVDSQLSKNTDNRKSLILLLGYFILVVLVILAFIPLIKKISSFHSYRISSTSMEPALYQGDGIFVNEDYYQHHALADGDLVVFRHNGYIIVKRISALPGETIEGRDGKLIRNNVLIDEPYVMFSKDNPMPDLETFASRQMPEGQIFVTGDSRDGSLDSRSTEYGPVYSSDVLGKVALVYLSSHKGQLGRKFYQIPPMTCAAPMARVRLGRLESSCIQPCQNAGPCFQAFASFSG